MAFNSNIVSSLVNSTATVSSVLSLSSQIVEKTMMLIKGRKTNRGIANFLFDVTKETIVDLTSDITDYPLEGSYIVNPETGEGTDYNYKTQSHYARHPVSISITGTCSDIRVHNPNDDWNIEKILDDLTEMTEKLAMISSSLQLGGATKECMQVVAYMKTIDTMYRKVKETVNRLKRVAKLFGSEFGQDETTSQQTAYNKLYALWEKGTPVEVETPWMNYKNCVIEKLSFTQPEETKQQTEINIKFKQLTVTEEVKGLFKGIFDKKTYEQMEAEASKTNSNPNVKDDNSSFLKDKGTKAKEVTDKDFNNAIKKDLKSQKNKVQN